MPKTVVVVEKDPHVREAVVAMLEALGHVAISFDESEKAWGVMDSVFVDVIVISHYPDDVDEVDAAGEAKARQPSIKVLAISGWELPKKLAYFVDSYIQKPFYLHQLEEAVDRLTQR